MKKKTLEMDLQKQSQDTQYLNFISSTKKETQNVNNVKSEVMMRNYIEPIKP